jgi:hypothetical protein
VRNYALVKRAAAQANLTLGRLDEHRALAIIAACDEIADGAHLDQFPTALLLGGGGTTSNMNLNEVIANRATQIGQTAVHSNDHANASQSTNDTFPTAMALTVMDLAETPLEATAWSRRVIGYESARVRGHALSRPDLPSRRSHRLRGSNSGGPGTCGAPGHRTIAGCSQRPDRGATWGNRGGHRGRRARGFR